MILSVDGPTDPNNPPPCPRCNTVHGPGPCPGAPGDNGGGNGDETGG